MPNSYRILLTAYLAVLSIADGCRRTAAQLLHNAIGGRDRGQSTAEYALVLLGAATVALVFLAWAGKTSRIGKLFDAVLDSVRDKVT